MLTTRIPIMATSWTRTIVFVLLFSGTAADLLGCFGAHPDHRANETSCYYLWYASGRVGCLNASLTQQTANEFSCLTEYCSNQKILITNPALSWSPVSINSRSEMRSIAAFITERTNVRGKEGQHMLEEVLVGMNEHGQWADNSDTFFIASLVNTSLLSQGKCVYFAMEHKTFVIKDCRTSATYGHHEFSWLLCKSRVKKILHSPMRDPIWDTRLGHCNALNSFHEQGNVHCYTVIPLTGAYFNSSGFGERELADDVCRATMVLYADGSVKKTALLSIVTPNEGSFIQKFMTRRVDRIQTVEARAFASRVLVGANDLGWMDGSETSFLSQFLNITDLDDVTCAFYDLIEKAIVTGKCGDKKDYYFTEAVSFAVCKGTALASAVDVAGKLDLLLKQKCCELSPWDPWRRSTSTSAPSVLLAITALSLLAVVAGRLGVL